MKKYVLVLIIVCPFISKSQIINTICGGNLGNGDSALKIGINCHNQVLDKQGNLYIADQDKHIVLKLSKSGIYSVVAGTGISGYSGDGGLATAAQLKNPFNIALDANGNLFIADSYDNRIRKITTNGIITTIAGTGTGGYAGDNGLAVNAELNTPDAVAVDKAGNIYIADLSNDRIRKVDNNGIITTVAGNGTFGHNGDGGVATLAQLGVPIGVAVDSLNEIFISDVGNNNVRMISATGIINTIAGSKFGASGFSGDGGVATSALLNGLTGNVVTDGEGNIYIPDTRNNRIRQIDKNGIINTIAGNGIDSSSGDGNIAINASISSPTGIAIDTATGNIYVTTYHYIRKLNSNNIISTVAGNGSSGFNGDNIPAFSSQLYLPSCVTTNSHGNIYIDDEGDYRIRKIDNNGNIFTVAGNGNTGSGSDSIHAITAQFGYTQGIFVDKNDNLYIADFRGGRVRMVDKNGIISTIAGNGTPGFSGDGGPATSAQLNSPNAIAIDNEGNIYIADRDNQRIRKVNTSGIITTVAGIGTRGFSGDGGTATSAELDNPLSLAIDASGNILVADVGNNRVRQISVNGIITTIAGNGSTTFSGDGGNATSASIGVAAVAIDSSGNILIADGTNHRIRKVNKNGIISTIAGGGFVYGDGGNPLAADLPGLSSVAVDKAGNIYVSDFTNHRVRKITNGVLAVTLLKFNAYLYNDNTILNWQTASEINTSYFNIQRSNDGVHFNTINKVTAAGNSASTKNYTCTDVNVTALKQDKLYYKLQEVDKDGKITYSNIQLINISGNHVFIVSPNPAKDFISITASSVISDAQISISNTNGKLLYSSKYSFTNGEQLKIPVAQFASETLFITITTSNGKEQFKVVKE